MHRQHCLIIRKEDPYDKVELQSIVGGQLQEKFKHAFEKVIENLQDPNTSYKVKRGINIKLDFVQTEARDNVAVSVLVTEKLAPQQDMNTMFYIGKDLRTGELYAEEYGKQVRGQMSLDDYQTADEPATEEKTVDEETGEILDDDQSKVVDLRKAAL